MQMEILNRAALRMMVMVMAMATVTVTVMVMVMLVMVTVMGESNAMHYTHKALPLTLSVNQMSTGSSENQMSTGSWVNRMSTEATTSAEDANDATGLGITGHDAGKGEKKPGSEAGVNAYGTMLYMGTPRDYEFYIAARVLLQSLACRLRDRTDLFVIASMDVPHQWVQTFLSEGVRVIRVPNIRSPFENRPYFNRRFKFSLNKLYAWRLVEYTRVVMLDVDNIFLRNPHELFMCGQFCAVFIDPCIFHTGLFVLEPSIKVFNDMHRSLSAGEENIDGADQGFLTSYFHDLLGKPLFQPPLNTTTRLDGHYRLPLGYQMDASYYYLRLKWRVPCGPNSVITFPSASWLKPWYWWSWPVLPLGLSWHNERKTTIGYARETQVLLVQSFLYCAILVLTSAAWLGLIPSSFMHRDSENIHRWSCVPKQIWLRHETLCMTFFTRVLPPIVMVISFLFPMWVIPTTSHPVMAWGVFLLGSFSLLVTLTVLLRLKFQPVLTPWILVAICLLVMAFPFYPNGIVRMLCVFGYSALSTPLLWWSLKTVAIPHPIHSQAKDQAGIKRNASD